MAKAEATVEELVSKIERGELRLPEMQRRYVWRSTRVRDLLRAVVTRDHRERAGRTIDLAEVAGRCREGGPGGGAGAVARALASGVVREGVERLARRIDEARAERADRRDLHDSGAGRGGRRRWGRRRRRAARGDQDDASGCRDGEGARAQEAQGTRGERGNLHVLLRSRNGY